MFGGGVGEVARLGAFGGRGDDAVRCDVVCFGHRGCKVPGSGVRGNKHVIFRVHGCARRSLASGTNRPFSDLDGPIWRRWSFSIGPDCGIKMANEASPRSVRPPAKTVGSSAAPRAGTRPCGALKSDEGAEGEEG